MIEHITIEGEKHPIRVSYYVLKKLKEETGKTLDEIATNDFELYEPILFYALEAGARAEKREMVLKREDMPFALDECLHEFLEKVPLFFPNKDMGRKGEGVEKK